MDRILVVDDEQSIRRLVKTVLTNAGYEVIEASDGEQGLERAREEKPALIIADIMMPIKDGYQLARDLRANPATASVPIIMLTALQGEQDELKAFQEGVDDYVTKPFRAPLLRARVAALLARSRALRGEPPLPSPREEAADRVTSGYSGLDKALGGGLPRGSNVLLIGGTGSGKSSLCRRFLAAGLQSSERCMAITLDDDPMMLRRGLDMLLSESIGRYEEQRSFRLVDAYSWSKGSMKGGERLAISGVLELNQLAGVVADAGQELGQSVNDKSGGCRTLDSLSSLFINFELASVQRFVAQLARTASSYGSVTSLFVVEEGTVAEQTINNIKYIMDGVVELKREGNEHLGRVTNMKWSQFSTEWTILAA
jgi:CheY-like chemotaxis protein/KaiC/GvpD/RAD55 family RecA-like ATPase